MNKIKTSFALIVLLLCAGISNAQVSVYSGYNLDFHDGYNGWKARSGSYSNSTSTQPVYNWTSTHDLPNTAMADGLPLFVINSDVNEVDPISATTTHPIKKIPAGYTHSSQINNKEGNATCSELKYTLDVEEDNALLTFNYAMVLQAPGHEGYLNPTFQIDVVLLNSANENASPLVDECAMFEKNGHTNLATLEPNTWFSTTYNYDTWVFCDWQKITINLIKYEGERVTIRIRLGDCAYNAHGAYGYVTASASRPSINVAGCAGEDDVITSALAPDGFSEYEWFKISANATSQDAMEEAYEQNPILGTDQEFFITEAMMEGATTQYFAVKLTSPRTQETRPYCVAYIRIKVDDMRPNFESATFIPVNVLNEKDEIGFKYNQVIPRSDAFPLIWEAITFDDGDSVAFVKGNTGIWTVSADTPLGENTRVVLDNSGNIDTIYHNYTPGNHSARRYAKSTTIVEEDEEPTYCERYKDFEFFVAERPSIAIVGTDTICKGASDTLYASSPENSAEASANYQYLWYQSIEDTINDPIFVGATYIVNNMTQTTEFVCKVNDPENNYYRFGYFTLYVQSFPELTLTGDTLLCLGQNANISVSDATGETVALQWTFNNPGANPVITNPQTNPVLQFAPSKDTTVFIIAKTSAGCIDYDSIHILVAIPTIKAVPEKICPGDEVTLIGGGQHTVAYSFAAVPTDASLDPDNISADPVVVTPMETTTYTVSGYSENGCSANASTIVKVIPYPEATISYSPSFVDMQNPILSVADVSPDATASYWVFSDGGVSDLRQVNYEFHDLSTDSVEIFLTSYNELGCSDQTSVKVPIELFSVWIPNAFTPDGDNINDYFFFITNNRLEDVVFEVFNRWGAKMFSFTADSYYGVGFGIDPMRDFGWDGKYNGNYVEQGTYVWRLSYRRQGETRVYDRSGSLTLIK